MTIKILKFFLFFLIFFLGFFSFGEALEVDYLEIGDLTPEAGSFLGDYIHYIYIFLIFVAGFFITISLIIAGIEYLTASGNPEKLSSAKKRILSIFLGAILLLSAVVILNLIDPRLTAFTLREFGEIPITGELPEIPLAPPQYDPLIRIETLADAILRTSPIVEGTARSLRDDVSLCDCSRADPFCMCQGGGVGDKNNCRPRLCFSGDNICPNSENIRLLQQKVFDQRDLLLYYRIRALSEIEDLERDIEQTIDPKIEWMNEQIQSGEEYFREKFEIERNYAIIEKEGKQHIMRLLDLLAEAILQTEDPLSNLSSFTDQCFSNVETSCNANCRGYCHDHYDGCEAVSCSGENPCPMDIINSELSEMSSQSSNIISICNQIINYIEELRERFN